MYHYHAYDLGVISAVPLPELQPAAEVPADVKILLGHIDWSPPTEATEDDLHFEIGAQTAYLHWSQLGKFCVRDGKEIVIDPLPGVDERMLRLPLLGTIMAILLHQRGYLVLHASAVAIDGEAVIFVGNKGRGKSTMAATLYARGHQLIADDVVALTVGEDCPRVIPGFPQFKLYPEALAATLGDDYRLLPELAAGYEKRGRLVTDRFARQPLPVKSIYILGLGAVSGLKLLEPQAALLTLIANSYMARFGRHLLHGADASAHLQQCAKLIHHVPVYRLERPNALPLLPSVAQLIEEQVHEDTVLV